ncbi:alpha-glucan family phosphorylase [Desulfobaculum bizertense]|uniref:Starch phosphorylase n=1 Tax=Desulfobaculum bizertense DSM 18034 TaxID=1121442 RepID=A0A1T4W7D4_9BACT|nr:alpha-glucan family phosphorylase [Desulfobaculum bizertense]UIJ39139.1 alpha-glucan family phosphorylase [Desulfobaculum bizertense]SKA73234.1 starch phosphorylase [Desulfobaculum bizertense DSM 18034]
MQPLRSFSVVPRLPENLQPLWKLAYNLLFSWNGDIVDLFARIDARLWRESENNPVAFINSLPQDVLEELSQDEIFLSRLDETLEELDGYLSRTGSAFSFANQDSSQPVVAYFSFEFGVSPCLPIYSGGLGILAGDHLKSASDLNIPLIGIGLAYQQGYFRQSLSPDGWQTERYPVYDFEQMPMNLVKDEQGQAVRFDVNIGEQRVEVQIWQAKVGRVDLYLMDTNIQENPTEFRQLTTRLYGGDVEMRLQQEVLLGIGGMKALKALGLEPKIIHMNEGHSAFAGLERIRVFMQEQGLNYEAAVELAASSCVFTTHTPVPAGNDRFSPDLMRRYFEGYAQQLGLAFKVFLALGREDPRDDAESFCMTVLALRLSRFNNGVSRLHGQVSRNMWQKVWPQFPTEDVPIGSITNGVHHPSWVADELTFLFDRYLGSNWREEADCEKVWRNAETIPDGELWRTHERLRERLVSFARERLRHELLLKGARQSEVDASEDVLDPQALTIGFARRFATYKRANMILSDKDRLLRMLENTSRPVQFIFAGKAHPQDNEGKKLIQQIVQFCRESNCRSRMVFLQDYDMEVAAHMLHGCDVWLNNPRVPLEACGTSGMKAMVNGVLNLSTLDGWWAEAYKPDNSVGWSIGRGEMYDDHRHQDYVESQILYTLLERDIIPEFYDRGHGNLPRTWVHKMKQALVELGPMFTSHRMVEDYVRVAYLPAYKNFLELTADGGQRAQELAHWRMDMMTKWDGLQLRNIQTQDGGELYVNERVQVSAEVQLNSIAPENVIVEIYSGALDQEGSFVQRGAVEMTCSEYTEDGWAKYSGTFAPGKPGRFGFTVRVLPRHPNLLDPHSLGLIHWAS